MNENLPKIINDFWSGNCTDIDYLNQRCKELVECCKFVDQSKIELDFKPDVVMQNFKSVEKEFVAKMKSITTQFQQDF